jgi:hypothetical protein
MNLSSSHSISHLRTPKFRAVTSLGLLVLYLWAGLNLDFVHKQVHEKDLVELHSAIHEGDPCHRFIYHHDKINGCEHASHIISNDVCKVCQLFSHANHFHLATKISGIENDHCVDSYEVIQTDPIFYEVKYTRFQRGPPQV